MRQMAHRPSDERPLRDFVLRAILGVLFLIVAYYLGGIAVILLGAG